MQGKIIRGIGGFYYVHTHQGVYECRARGIFRKDKEKPLPGDLVSISVLDETEKKGNLDEILPRTNSLIRPAVANVDQALVIFALVSPKPNFNLLDRFLVLMEKQGIPALICMNKTDLASDEMIAEVRERYRTSGYPLLFVSAAQKEGIEAIREYLRGKTTTVAGPSGVGKSSLINPVSLYITPSTITHGGYEPVSAICSFCTTSSFSLFSVSTDTFPDTGSLFS